MPRPLVALAVILLAGCGSTSTKTATSTKTVTTTPTKPPAGVVEILSDGTKRAYYIAADHLPPSRGFFYGTWLNSPTSNEALSKSPPVGSSGRLEGGAILPANAGSFDQILVTRETSTRPSHPGPVVLRGPFRLGSPPAEAIPSHGPTVDARLTLTPPRGE